MKKNIKKIIIFCMIILAMVLYNYNKARKDKNAFRTPGDIGKIVQIQIIDTNNSIKKIHENYKEENYEMVDIIIDGNYYRNVGIRTKGSAIYNLLEFYDSDRHSYKVKLDYTDTQQKYNGMTEIHLNTNVMDATCFREYLAYKVYSKMGMETQSYSLGNLIIGNENIGLITLVEVINEDYVSYKYNSKDGNLYKPDAIGTEMQYKNDEISTYKGIFDNTKTLNTNNEDKQRLISIFKKLKNSKSTETIEECFFDFDRIIKYVAINQAIGNIDHFVGVTRRNFYIYEENGKMDIIPYDFNISFALQPIHPFPLQYTHDEIELVAYKYSLHSIILDLIMENDENYKKYSQYLEEVTNIFEKWNEYEYLDKIENIVAETIKNTENEFYTYDVHKKEVESVKQFLQNRVEIVKKEELLADKNVT